MLAIVTSVCTGCQLTPLLRLSVLGSGYLARWLFYFQTRHVCTHIERWTTVSFDFLYYRPVQDVQHVYFQRCKPSKEATVSLNFIFYVFHVTSLKLNICICIYCIMKKLCLDFKHQLPSFHSVSYLIALLEYCFTYIKIVCL